MVAIVHDFSFHFQPSHAGAYCDPKEAMAKLRRTDLSKYNDGVVVKHPDGWWIKLRCADHPRVRERISSEMAIARGKIVGIKDEDVLPDAVYQELIRRVYAEEVILEWGEIDEAPEGYTSAKANELMQDPENIEFRDLVMPTARNLRAYEKRGVEAILGN